MVYLKSVENVITLGKLIGLLFLFCLPLISILFLKTKRNDLARPVMGTIFLDRYMPSPFYPASILFFQLHGGHGQSYASISHTIHNTKYLNTYHKSISGLAASS